MATVGDFIRNSWLAGVKRTDVAQTMADALRMPLSEALYIVVSKYSMYDLALSLEMKDQPPTVEQKPCLLHRKQKQ